MDMMPKEDAKQALEQALLNGRPMLVAGKWATSITLHGRFGGCL